MFFLGFALVWLSGHFGIFVIYKHTDQVYTIFPCYRQAIYTIDSHTALLYIELPPVSPSCVKAVRAFVCVCARLFVSVNNSICRLYRSSSISRYYDKLPGLPPSHWLLQDSSTHTHTHSSISSGKCNSEN